MISAACDFEQFVEAIKDKDYFEVVYLANQEATEAWRRSYRLRTSPGAQRQNSVAYEHVLKGFISYLRYGLTPPGLSGTDLALFQSVCDNLRKKKQGQVRC
jgi:hypothetical protein